MANTFKIKTNDAMPTSAGTPLTLYTVPSSTTTIVLGLMLCNVDTSQRLVDVQIVSDTSDTEVEITATTIDINGAVEISGATTQTGISTSAAKDVFNAGMSVKNGSSSAGFIEFFEDSDNGTNKVTLVGPASTGDVTLTLPAVTDTVAAVGDITALAIALG